MLVQVVTFNLEGLSGAEYARLCEQELAEPMAAMPGLVSKTWLADAAGNTYGGVYVWEDQAAIEGFARSELFRGFASNPAVRNIQAHVFHVMEEPSRITNGLGVAVV